MRSFVCYCDLPTFLWIVYPSIALSHDLIACLIVTSRLGLVSRNDNLNKITRQDVLRSGLALPRGVTSCDSKNCVGLYPTKHCNEFPDRRRNHQAVVMFKSSDQQAFSSSSLRLRHTYALLDFVARYLLQTTDELRVRPNLTVIVPT